MRDKPLKQGKGQTIVEFALVLPVVLLLLLGLVDLGLMFYVNLTMQNAVRQGARTCVVGNSTGGPDTMSALKTTIINSSNGLYAKNIHSQPQLITYVYQSGSTFANNTSANTNVGGPGQIVIVQLNYTWPLLTPVLKPFFPSGQYNFTVKATMRNEVFSGG